MSTGIQPCETSAQCLYFQFLVLKKLLVYGGDFQFSPCRRLDILGYFHHLVGIEIESHHGIVGLRLGRFFFNREAVAFLVEFRYAISFGVTDPITEYRCFLVLFGSTYGFSQHGGQAVAVEYVITQYKADGIISDEFLADDESLSQSVGRRLFRIFKAYSEIASVS